MDHLNAPDKESAEKDVQNGISPMMFFQVRQFYSDVVFCYSILFISMKPTLCCDPNELVQYL